MSHGVSKNVSILIAEYTAAYGFHIKKKGDITTHDIVAIIEEMRIQFGDGYDFAPEANSQGGIIFLSWPETEQRGYKAVRFGSRRGICYEWPWVHNENTATEDWRNKTPQ
jgi:hypothetical protein